MDAFQCAICSMGLEEAVKAIGYIWNYEALVESFVKNLKKLDDRLSTVKANVNYYKVKQRRVIRDDVKLWIQIAGKVVDDAKEFLKTTEENATGCCGHDSNWGRRYEDAKKAENQGEEIKVLKADGKKFDEVYFRQLHPEPMAQIWARGYVPLPSMDETIEQLKCFLQVGGIDDKLVVGIYGVGGVGKTRVAEKLAADMELAGVKVVVVNGRNGKKKRIQRQIAERVGFEYTNKAVTERARCLYETLDAMKLLIIFDNVNAKIDLTHIGIPQPAPENSCRILVVSETLRACEDMHSQKNLQINPLTQTEAKTFADGLAIKYNWFNYSLADISSEKAGLPAEIERLILKRTTSQTTQIASSSTGAWSSTSPLNGGGISIFFLDVDALDIAHKNTPQYWLLDRSKSSPEAVLIEVLYLHIEGKAIGPFPGTTYAAYFVYALIKEEERLSHYNECFKTNPVEMVVGRNSRRCYLDPSKSSEAKPTERADKWLEIEMGRFYSNDYADSQVVLIVKNHDTSIVKAGLRIHGIELRELDPS